MFLTIIKSIAHLTIVVVIWPLSVLLNNRDDLSWDTGFNLSFGSLTSSSVLEFWWNSSLWCRFFFGFNLLASCILIFDAVIMILGHTIRGKREFLGSILKLVTVFLTVMIVNELTFSE